MIILLRIVCTVGYYVTKTSANSSAVSLSEKNEDLFTLLIRFRFRFQENPCSSSMPVCSLKSSLLRSKILTNVLNGQYQKPCFLKDYFTSENIHYINNYNLWRQLMDFLWHTYVLYLSRDNYYQLYACLIKISVYITMS